RDTRQRYAMTGTRTTKWSNMHKGIGYITHAGSKEDVIIRHATLRAAGLAQLVEGQRLEFEAKMGSQGLEAIMVRPI
ncbi:cold shock domain-containing protein, partial [Escherichia coli]|uniref:cold-shock protein n=1 Tax=Escherichia coli TaxID=562 RepID=UPI00285CD56B